MLMEYFLFTGYNKYDFWTSGNNLGTDMYLWMSTGLPFNATFNYMRRLPMDAPSQHADDSIDPLDVPQGSTAPQRTARHGYVVTIVDNNTKSYLTIENSQPYEMIEAPNNHATVTLPNEDVHVLRIFTRSNSIEVIGSHVRKQPV